MKTPTRPEHHALAGASGVGCLEGLGEVDPALRQAVAASATDGRPAPPPYDALARQIGDAPTAPQTTTPV
jgi:hypothetical protein